MKLLVAENQELPSDPAWVKGYFLIFIKKSISIQCMKIVIKNEKFQQVSNFRLLYNVKFPFLWKTSLYFKTDLV